MTQGTPREDQAHSITAHMVEAFLSPSHTRAKTNPNHSSEHSRTLPCVQEAMVIKDIGEQGPWPGGGVHRRGQGPVVLSPWMLSAFFGEA